MKKGILSSALCLSALALGGCASHYTVADMTRSRILIDSRYDATPDAAAATFIAPYKASVDSVMSPVVGEIARNMEVRQPESEISNLLCDILVWAAGKYDEKPDFAVYNVGGIRAAFSKGPVTYGDVLEVAPFENKICFLTLSGDKVMKLFREIAAQGGQGVSHGVNLVITADGKLVSAKLHGKEIDEKAAYRVTTIDYVAHGNDRLDAFKSKTDFVSPQSVDNNVRFLIMDYFRDRQARGEVVDSKIEGRIVIK